MSFRKSPNPMWPNGQMKQLAAAALLVGVALLAGCRGDRSDNPPRQFFPDMDQQPRWNPQSGTPFYVADGRTMRQPVARTVPFGVSAVVSDAACADPFNRNRDEFLGDAGKNDAERSSIKIYTGQDDMMEYVTRVPIPVTIDLLRTGQKKFNIYCATCHGLNGEGAGPGAGTMVGQRWNIPVPSFHDPKYLPGGARGQEGYLFLVSRQGVINAGQQTMPGYAHALDTQDSWAVTAYIRVLQTSHLGTLADVPEAERAALGAPPPPPAPEAATPETPAPATPAPETEAPQ